MSNSPGTRALPIARKRPEIVMNPAAIPEFAGGQMNLNATFFSEQGQGVAFVSNRVPVELIVCVKREPVQIASFTGGGADLVTAFLNQQGFIAGDQVNRSQAFLQKLRELAGLGFHGDSGSSPSAVCS